jgi:hypothetical protein
MYLSHTTLIIILLGFINGVVASVGAPVFRCIREHLGRLGTSGNRALQACAVAIAAYVGSNYETSGYPRLVGRLQHISCLRLAPHLPTGPQQWPRARAHTDITAPPPSLSLSFAEPGFPFNYGQCFSLQFLLLPFTFPCRVGLIKY